MRLIKSSAEIIREENPFRKIEIAGRTCYKSDSEMNEQTARKFFNKLRDSKHHAMLEHATFCFQVSPDHLWELRVVDKFLNITIDEVDGEERCLVSGNLRALNETLELSLLVALYDIDPQLVYAVDESAVQKAIPQMRGICVPFDVDAHDLPDWVYKTHKYVTYHLVCDRGVSHEIVRHRPASYAQESTRYCNYAKAKYGNEITCIIPAGYDEWDTRKKFVFIQGCEQSEKSYLELIACGCTPQQARAVLVNALKTEVIMTTNLKEYDHFFNLRYFGTTGAPHPDMLELATEMYKEMVVLNPCMLR